MKKLISVIMTMIMVMSTATIGFAEENGIGESDSMHEVDNRGTISEIDFTINHFKIIERKSTRALDVTGTEFFGAGWKSISYPKKYSKKYKVLSPNEENIRDMLLLGLTPIYGGIPSIGAAVTKMASRYVKEPDYKSIGGIYTKTFYIAKPTKKESENVKNVPVACYVKKVTIIYRSPDMRIDNYVTSFEYSEAVQNLSWYKMQSVNNGF